MREAAGGSGMVAAPAPCCIRGGHISGLEINNKAAEDNWRVRVGDMNANKGHRARIAIDAVVSDVNLVALILAGNIGPSGFAAASLVCRAWLSVCREEERVVRGVAAYQGGLTKGVFMKLLAVSSQEADALPRAKRLRFFGGHYFLYRVDAVDAVLAAGGIKAWRGRLRVRGKGPCIARWPSQQSDVRLSSQQEERLRAQESQRRAWGLVRAGR